MASDFHTHFCRPGKAELVNNGKGIAPLWSLSCHPWDTEKVPDSCRSDLELCSALGEIGFDKSRGILAYPDEQLALFRTFLQLAVEFKKPVVIHAVGSMEYLFQEKKNFPETKMLVHGFAKHNPRLLGQLLDQGFYVSLHPSLTGDEEFRTFLKNAPSCRVGLETDDREDLVIEDLYARMDIPGFERNADSHFREFLQI